MGYNYDFKYLKSFSKSRNIIIRLSNDDEQFKNQSISESRRIQNMSEF